MNVLLTLRSTPFAGSRRSRIFSGIRVHMNLLGQKTAIKVQYFVLAGSFWYNLGFHLESVQISRHLFGNNIYIFCLF